MSPSSAARRFYARIQFLTLVSPLCVPGSLLLTIAETAMLKIEISFITGMKKRVRASAHLCALLRWRFFTVAVYCSFLPRGYGGGWQ